MDFRYFCRTLLCLLANASLATATASASTFPPGVVVNYHDPTSQVYVGNPSIAILPNGDYVASQDAYGAGNPNSRTFLFRSQDRGATWSDMGVLNGQYESKLFVHNQDLYILGGGTTEGGTEFASIRKSTDGGETWTVPLSSTTGRLVTGGGFNAAATPVIEHDGRIWRAMERVEPTIPEGNSTNFRSFVLSAPVDADFLNADSWTVSNSLLMDDYLSGKGWLEGSFVVTPQGSPAVFLRTAWLGEKAAIINVSPDGTTESFQPATGLVDFPSGGSSKFSVRYDEVSELYWSITNNLDRSGDIRNVLELVSSPDLISWTKEATLLTHPDETYIGFQTVDWEVDGTDIVFLSRTAWEGSPGFHEANYMTFHRVPNFRSFALDTTTTISSVNDGMIDQHVNFNSDALGVAQFEHSHGPGPANQHIVVGRLANDYGSPVTGPSKFGVLKFDVSDLSGELITNAVLRLVQTANAEAPPNRGGAQFASATEVYVVNSGDFDEATSSWQNYIGGVDDASLSSYLASGALTHLGSLANGSSPGGHSGPGGDADFIDVDLTAVIQGWADGTRPNFGLLLLNAASLGPAPNAPGDIIARYAAHENSSHQGPQLIVSHAPLPLPGDYNQDDVVDAADYVVWRNVVGREVAVGTSADGNRDGKVDEGDYTVWKQRFGETGGGQASSDVGSLPEPGTMYFALTAVTTGLFFARKRFEMSARGTAWLCLLAASVMLANTCAIAEVRLPHVFSDQMVLQRELPLRIWGWADPQEDVQVEFASQVKQTTADAQGNWEVEFPAMQADGASHQLTVRGKNAIQLDDVVLGEVWLGSGQSNMEMPMTETGDLSAIVAAEHPEIRLFHVTHAKASKPSADVDATWRPCTPETVAPFSAPLYFFGRRLQQELKVPIGLIGSAWGGSPIEQWTPSSEPTGEMYNAMIAPLCRFPIQGVVWYQGEANVNRNERMQYARQMETLIASWRGAWQRDLPFYFVQIAPWDYSGYETCRVAEFREAQASCMTIPKTGMVVTTDLVEPAGVADGHPRNKRDVGERLARWALAKTYDRDGLVYSGPVFKEFKIQGDKIRLFFDHADGLKTADSEPLREFEISGANGHFAVATAVIDDETVVVSSPLVPTPVQARFAWRNLTRPNLVNAAGLPAVPFRTAAGSRAAE